MLEDEDSVSDGGMFPYRRSIRRGRCPKKKEKKKAGVPSASRRTACTKEGSRLFFSAISSGKCFSGCILMPAELFGGRAGETSGALSLRVQKRESLAASQPPPPPPPTTPLPPPCLGCLRLRAPRPPPKKKKENISL